MKAAAYIGATLCFLAAIGLAAYAVLPQGEDDLGWIAALAAFLGWILLPGAEASIEFED